ncbi:Prostaglandin E synthase 2 [Hibiscus syriacus]|uniref:Prostaglandin E synthase 2 n=1 Tax=Hibiscus syriacus TaxID=106335 RepID=A0A6A2WKJ4_HIBSY|nr:Prostaglandin E synthase 2 [Hibiscus syriacus]
MRKVNGLATLSRALSCGGAIEPRMVQAALMSTCSSSSSNSHIFSQKLGERLGLSRSSLARSVAGTMLFSAAASWVDNHLVHVLSPNIYRSTSEALESFDYITTHGNFSFTERFVAKYAGAAAMYFVSKKLKKKHNITDERAALYEAAETWLDALKGRHYLGCSKPNLADLAVFGVLRPIRYLTSVKDMVEHTRIDEWYSRMENAVEEPARIKE